MLPNALITGTPLKPVDLLISSALHAVGHCALQSALTVPSVMEEKPWKTLSKVSSTAFLPVLLTALDVAMVFTTASRSQVKFGVTIS